MSFAAHVETPVTPVPAAEGTERALLVGFLRQLSPAARSLDLTDETPLLSSGVLDSLAILQLMSFLADELGIEIADDDFTLDNFETVGALLAFVRRRKG